MAEMMGIYMTQQGYELLAKKQLSIENTEFTRMAAGSGDIGGLVPRDMTGLEDENYSFPISSKDIVNKTTVMVTGILCNKVDEETEIEEGFFVTHVGLYANDPDEGEILYSVMLFEKPDYMPAYNSKGISNITYTFYTDVADAEKVEFVFASNAFVGAEAFERFKEYILKKIEGMLTQADLKEIYEELAALWEIVNNLDFATGKELQEKITQIETKLQEITIQLNKTPKIHVSEAEPEGWRAGDWWYDVSGGDSDDEKEGEKA